jgi:hypothetical protein
MLINETVATTHGIAVDCNMFINNNYILCIFYTDCLSNAIMNSVLPAQINTKSYQQFLDRIEEKKLQMGPNK